MAQYINQNLPPDKQAIQNLWLEYTILYKHAVAALMHDVYVELCCRLDGTTKTGKRGFVVGENNGQVCSPSAKILLLMVNEIGQWKHFSFRQEEDKSAVQSALECYREAQLRRASAANVAIIVDNARAPCSSILSVMPEAQVR